MREMGPVLSDQTLVSGNTWAELKERAMQPNYVTSSLFVKYLNKREKEVLRKLIEAQTTQGDMEVLIPFVKDKPELKKLFSYENFLDDLDASYDCLDPALDGLLSQNSKPFEDVDMPGLRR